MDDADLIKYIHYEWATVTEDETYKIHKDKFFVSNLTGGENMVAP